MDQATDILRKIRYLELKTKRLVDSAFAGQYHSVFKGKGMNFDEVREYQPGDEIRTIDWNVTARTGITHIKKFKEERELSVMLVVDISASGNFGSTEKSKREVAAEVASILAMSAVRNGDKVGLLLFTDSVELYLPPRKGRLHMLRIVREVLFFEPKRRSTDIAIALDFLNRVRKRRSIVFLISDFEAPSFESALSFSSQRHDVVAVSLHDPREEILPDAGIVLMQDAETGEQIEINTSDSAIRAAFKELALRDYQTMMDGFRRLKVDTISLRTDEDYFLMLRHFFQQREKRGIRV